MGIMNNRWNFLKEKVLRLTNGVKETSTTPNAMQNMSFSNADFAGINRFFLDEINVWYQGDSTKMLEFYTNARINEYPSEYIRSRNCVEYFWAQSATATKIKRTTGNLVHSITTTLRNIIGTPDVYSGKNGYADLIGEMLDQNDFTDSLYDRQVIKTLYEGWGAYRIDIDTENNDYPKIRYFRAQDVLFARDGEDLKAIVYLSNYVSEDKKKYLLVETRYVKTKDGIKYSCIDKECYIVSKTTMTRVPLKECPNITDRNEHIEIPNVPFILGEPCIFYDIDGLENEGLYGRSIFYGKIDALDDYDQALSMSATCVRRSAPKVSYPVESVDTSPSGMARLPNAFDTEYIQVPNQLTGDGLSSESNTPKVIQPQLNLKIYEDQMKLSREVIMGGIMSLNDIGLNEQTFFRDSAEAIRERSRQTLYTVELVRKKEQKILKSLLNKCIFLKELFWDNKNVSIKDMKNFDVVVRYDKFLSPSKEQKIKSYLPMYQSGAISIEQFVRTVYEDEMSEQEMQDEINKIKELKLMSSGLVKGQDATGGENFMKTPSFEKNTSPYQDPIANMSDNSGMNNYNRSLKAVNSKDF